MAQLVDHTKPVMTDAEHKMQKALEATRGEFQNLHTGRANVALVENVKVDYYNTITQLKGLAAITTPDSQTIVIQPWDVSALSAIEKAIQTSGLGLVPNNDGRVIRVKMPQLTEERRVELDKLIRRIAEEGRVSIRNIRHDAIDALRKLEKGGSIGEDISKSGQKRVQDMTDKFIKFVDEALQKKEHEIKQV